MPHIDARSGEVVIRIVYDGAPEAGKTTNVQHLCNQISLARRGAAKSPGTTGARTEFFDWLDFSGGFLDGRRVRCQLVSVPGQPRLLHRRRYLLEAADAIVFVADSRREGIEEAGRNVAATLRIAARVAGEIPVGIVLQANKQDLAGAMPPGDVLRALGMTPTTPTLPSIASTGAGVMDTFILAVRLATDRVRTLMKENGTGLDTSEQTPDGLHTAMLALVEDVEPARPQAEPEATPSREPSIESSTVRVPPPDESRRANLLGAVTDVALPQAQEIASGHVWPPVRGRTTFGAAVAGRLVVPETVCRWAPPGALEIASDAGWLLHSSDRWVFDAEAAARLRLHALVRRQLPQLDLVPEGRALAIVGDGTRWRIWLLTPRIPSIADEAASAAAEGGVAALVTFLGRALAGFRALREVGLDASSRVGAAGLALQQGRLVSLVLDEGDVEDARQDDTPLALLTDLMARLSRDREKIREWFEAEGRALLERAPELGGGR